MSRQQKRTARTRKHKATWGLFREAMWTLANCAALAHSIQMYLNRGPTYRTAPVV